jgi:predicted dehydrogenase
LPDKVNIAVVGCGYWGPNLVRNFSALPNCNVSIVCDKNSERLEFIKNEFPHIAITLNYEEIIHNNEIDAVCIATPVKTHAELAISALKSGKHVFVEKPLAASLQEAEYIMSVADKNSLKVAVGHVFQFAPAVRKIKELISGGAIGDLYHITSMRINLGPPNTDIDVIWDLGPHDFSIILYLLNEYPEKVIAVNNHYPFGFLRNSSDKIINNSHIDLTFKSGISAHIHLSWLSSVKVRLMYLFGSEGTIVYDEMLALDGKVKVIGTTLSSKKLGYATGDIHIIELEQHEPLRKECEHFIDSILYNRDLVNDVKNGFDVLKLIIDTHKIN